MLDQSESDISLEIDSSLSSPLNDMQETIDMPYQYLIERDIEKSKSLNKRKCTVGTNYNSIPSTFIIPDEKKTHKKCETIVSSLDKNNIQTNIENIIESTNENNLKDKKCDKIKPPPLILQNDNNNFKNLSNEIDKIIKSPIKINERTPIKSPFFKLTSTPTQSPLSKSHSVGNFIDQITPKSANITDLVMEGLMFTIKQDKDSLTVVEQKTKLEPDEVLENSEKIETQEGAECLVNSSLLKLENLITKIDKSNSSNNSNKNKTKSNNLPCSYFGQNIDNHNYNNNYLNNNNNNSDVVLLNRMSKSEVDEFFSLPKKHVYADESKNGSIESKSESVKSIDSMSMDVDDSKDEPNKATDSMSMDFEYIYHDFKDDFPKVTEKNSKKSKKIKEKIVKSTDDSDTDILDDSDDSDDNDDTNDKNKYDKTGNESDTPSMADEDIIPEALQNHDESNLLMDDHDDGDDEDEEEEEKEDNYYTPPDVPFTSKKLKNKSPRIVSNEVVSFDLSTLRSVKPNRKSTDTDKSNDLDKSNDNDDKTTTEDSNIETDDDKINSDVKKSIHEEVNDDNKKNNSDELKMLDDKSSIEDEKKIENSENLKDAKLDDKITSNDKEKLITINTKKPDDLNDNAKSPDNTKNIIKMEINGTKSSNSYNKKVTKKSTVVPRLTRKSLSMKRKLESLDKNDPPRKDVEIEMWKFLQDMSKGVRVVVKRLDLSDMSNLVAKNCIK